MKKVSSSNVDTIHYDPATRILEVVFKNNKFYHYNNVSQNTYNNFEKSNSLGEFLHKHIKPHHSILKKG